MRRKSWMRLELKRVVNQQPTGHEHCADINEADVNEIAGCDCFDDSLAHARLIHR
jgi:hypothetical protein